MCRLKNNTTNDIIRKNGGCIMKDFRITDIRFYFRSNGKTNPASYDQNTYLGMERNFSFYSKVVEIIGTKRKTGIASTTIDEIYIPQDMWDVGIWEKSILLQGTALFVPDGEVDTACAEIELIFQTGSNPAILTGKNIEFIPAQNVMKITNLDVSIICSSVLLKECE